MLHPGAGTRQRRKGRSSILERPSSLSPWLERGPPRLAVTTAARPTSAASCLAAAGSCRGRTRCDTRRMRKKVTGIFASVVVVTLVSLAVDGLHAYVAVRSRAGLYFL